eukprot:TRINITY_DN48607_c0_g1_i1.p1 TRINITY_DN48607_c0_g1~~TRINITY_DN48607_c0_g1_i1.p1  ORF type:complete len:131 (-),score=17.16 TRINITY_DN48607_c0_g1_i1:135-527(-)
MKFAYVVAAAAGALAAADLPFGTGKFCGSGGDRSLKVDIHMPHCCLGTVDVELTVGSEKLTCNHQKMRQTYSGVQLLEYDCVTPGIKKFGDSAFQLDFQTDTQLNYYFGGPLRFSLHPCTQAANATNVLV